VSVGLKFIGGVRHGEGALQKLELELIQSHMSLRVLVFVVGAFAEMSEDVSRICGITAHDLARTHVSYYNGDAKRPKGMYRQRIQKAWGTRRLGRPCTPALAHTSSFDTDLTRNTRAPHFTPQHWLLCHMGLY